MRSGKMILHVNLVDVAAISLILLFIISLSYVDNLLT